MSFQVETGLHLHHTVSGLAGKSFPIRSQLLCVRLEGCSKPGGFHGFHCYHAPLLKLKHCALKPAPCLKPAWTSPEPNVACLILNSSDMDGYRMTHGCLKRTCVQYMRHDSCCHLMMYENHCFANLQVFRGLCPHASMYENKHEQKQMRCSKIELSAKSQREEMTIQQDNKNNMTMSQY